MRILLSVFCLFWFVCALGQGDKVLLVFDIDETALYRHTDINVTSKALLVEKNDTAFTVESQSSRVSFIDLSVMKKLGLLFCSEEFSSFFCTVKQTVKKGRKVDVVFISTGPYLMDFVDAYMKVYDIGLDDGLSLSLFSRDAQTKDKKIVYRGSRGAEVVISSTKAYENKTDVLEDYALCNGLDLHSVPLFIFENDCGYVSSYISAFFENKEQALQENMKKFFSDSQIVSGEPLKLQYMKLMTPAEYTERRKYIYYMASASGSTLEGDKVKILIDGKHTADYKQKFAVFGNVSEYRELINIATKRLTDITK